MKRRLFHLAATVLGGLAVASVTTACWLYYHQPETPEELLK